MSTPLPAAAFRLRTIPWNALGPYLEPLEGALARVLSGAEAARELGRLLRTLHPLESAARQALAEAVFGVSLWRRALAYHAGLGEAPAAAHPRLLLFSLLRDLAALPTESAASKCGLAPEALPPQRPPAVSPAVRLSFPDWLWSQFESEVGPEEAVALGEALNLPGPVFLRVNTERISRSQLAQRLAEEDGIETAPARLSPVGLEVTSLRPNILGARTHQEGLFEVQDEGSQLLGLLLDVKPGHKVFDACAGAGGKTLLLASQLAGQGELHAYDPDRSRLERLEKRVYRARAMPVRIHWQKTQPDARYDRILVDAPCSELGSLRRGPDVRFRLNPGAFEPFPPLQRDILEDAIGHLRPGGQLLYATCTLRREENEEVVEALLATHPELEQVRPQTPVLPDDAYRGRSVRLLPHRHRTDGFFAALLRHKG